MIWVILFFSTDWKSIIVLSMIYIFPINWFCFLSFSSEIYVL
nr:MAG TPA_asm: hypothetical protein [Bacteriophage sp.]